LFIDSQRGKAITAPEQPRINNQIRAREVRVITDSKENMVVPLSEALSMAEAKGLDLVEVSPNADPPVCRIMDFGKFMYEQQRKERKARKQQKVIEVKEIVIQPKTADHHLSFKIRDARRWLEDGMKVRVRIRFRGREIAHADIGRARLDKIAAELKDVGVLEQYPQMEGSTMLMVIAPSQEAVKKKPAPAEKIEKENGKEV
jgi:translation initiation factor IF-3